ncbi:MULTISPECIES: DUF6894 family protein [unclassified Bradyrhizobium]|jgi:hypothetical protein|uniref:DUF6894 family protein n=1 Tax=unclassified Bradyrhizobium TaxID=2631580 RepID=UPI001FF7E0DC|nr:MULTISPECIES: hypothetical protein [unclassified Bradyrhizobium]MCK1599098.1 hypothetical protein [Bradyrhizobium sp. 164]UPK31370.1 hypothetical protein IVB26_42070 [Bradyrhizobium sp. 195]
MPRFHFDYHEAERVTIDEVGQELQTADVARRMAMVALGEAVRDFTLAARPGSIAIVVRNNAGILLRVCALIDEAESW